MKKDEEYYKERKELIEDELRKAKRYFNREAPDATEMEFVEEMHRNFMEHAEKLVGKDVLMSMNDIKLVAFNAMIENMLNTYRQKGYEIDQPVEAYNIIALFNMARMICSLPDIPCEDGKATYDLAEQAYFTAQQMDAELSCFQDPENETK